MTEVALEVDTRDLSGSLDVPQNAAGIVIFAHGSGSSRHSPRNRQVAKRLNDEGFATLLFDLLTPDEEADRNNVFEIGLLARRPVAATRWVRGQPATRSWPAGYFGASTAAAAG